MGGCGPGAGSRGGNAPETTIFGISQFRFELSRFDDFRLGVPIFRLRFPISDWDFRFISGIFSDWSHGSYRARTVLTGHFWLLQLFRGSYSTPRNPRRKFGSTKSDPDGNSVAATWVQTEIAQMNLAPPPPPPTPPHPTPSPPELRSIPGIIGDTGWRGVGAAHMSNPIRSKAHCLRFPPNQGRSELRATGAARAACAAGSSSNNR